MDRARPNESDEAARLRQKLAETDDPDIRSALLLKLQSLETVEPVKAEAPKNLPSAEEEKQLRVLLAALETRYDAAEDEDVKEVLGREVQRVHFLLLGHTLPGEEEPTPAETLTATSAQIERAETLIREARVERMRSNKAKADALMQEAAEAAPGSVEVLSALGDEMVERKQYAKARDMYRQALAIRPRDLVLERKLGDLVLQSGPTRSVEEMLRSESPFINEEEAIANARTATYLSFFCPGLGHVVLGKTVQGITTFLVWGVMVFWVFLRKDDLRDLLAAAGVHSKVHGGGGALVLLPLAVALILHIGAITSCASRAKRWSKREVSRPVPPMNLPFE